MKPAIRLAVDGIGSGREVRFINVFVLATEAACAKRVAKRWPVAVGGRVEYGEWDKAREKRHDYSVGNVELLTAPRPAEAEEPAKPAATGRSRRSLSHKRLGRASSPAFSKRPGRQVPAVDAKRWA